MESDSRSCHKLRKTDGQLLNVLESNGLCKPTQLLEAYALSAPPHTDAASLLCRNIMASCIGCAISSEIASCPVDQSIPGLDTGNLEKTQELLSQLPPVKDLDTLEYHASKQSKTLAEQVEVRLSETCKKRFVVFDQSGGLRRIIFHPAVVTKMSETAPVNVDKMMDYFSCLHDTSLRAVSKLKERMDSLPLFEFAHCNTGSIESVSVRHPEMAVARETIDMHDSDYDHDEIEDIDALLSSDSDDEADEVNSTGLCFGDLTWNDSPCAGVCTNLDHKKRKWVDACLCSDEEDDADSAAVTILGTGTEKVISSTFKAGIIKQSPLDDADSAAVALLGFQPAKAISSTPHAGIVQQSPPDIDRNSGLCSYDLSWPDELSSSNAGSNKQRQLTNAMKQARKGQIRSAFRLLCGLLPDGGEGRGTANVLDEAIEFVKDLEMKVKRLEAKRYVG